MSGETEINDDATRFRDATPTRGVSNGPLKGNGKKQNNADPTEAQNDFSEKKHAPQAPNETAKTDNFSLTGRPITEMPKQRRVTSVSHRKIKISQDLRQQLDAKKVRVGLCGELAVLDDEKKRLARVGLDQYEPVHVSLTDDGKGYDIQSWMDGKKIYIEVKTTVGDFWSGLYFTENEKATMERLKENYYLYRICNFSIETGEGALFVYAGEKLITDTFEFNSNRYILSAKEH